MLSGRKYIKKIIFLLLCSISFFASAQQVPVPEWIQDIGGLNESKVTGIAIDKFDNVYVAGNFQGIIALNKTSSNPTELTSVGSYDMFLAKYTSAGELLWAKNIGGTEWEQVNNLAIDGEGNAYMAGFTGSPYMDCDPGPLKHIYNNTGFLAAMVIKFNSDGEFVWERSISGSVTQQAHVVTADKDGNIIVVGMFSSPEAYAGTYKFTNSGDMDGFIVKYNNAGDVLFAFSIGDISEDQLTSVKTDSQGNIVVGGFFEGNIDLNPLGAPRIMTSGDKKAFFAKYTPAGLLTWVRTLDGQESTVSSLAVSANDEIYLTGHLGSSLTITSPENTISHSFLSNMNLYIARISAAGTPVWIQPILADGLIFHPYYISTDIEENAYVGGYMSGKLIFKDATTTKTLNTLSSGIEVFFAKYTSTGDLGWAFNFGDVCNSNYGHKIAIDSKKNVILGGSFCGTADFNVGTCVQNIKASGLSDGFVAKYSQTFFGISEITAFELNEQSEPALIFPQNRTIRVRLKEGTDPAHVHPVVTINAGITAPASGQEADLSIPKTYKVSYNCISNDWTVIATVDRVDRFNICSGAKQVVSVYKELSATYLWEQFNGTDWVAATGINDQVDYTFEGLINNGATPVIVRLRAKITEFDATFYGNEQEISIYPVTTGNTITTPQTLFCNGSAIASITGSDPQGATGLPVQYKWQKSLDDKNWIEIPGKTSRDLLTDEFNDNNYFRRITITGTCEAYSNSLFIEVYAQTAPNAGPDAELCSTRVVTLNANSPSEIETGTWKVLSPLSYQPFNASNVHDPNAVIDNFPQDQIVRLQWSITNNKCSITNTDEVQIISFSDIDLKAPDRLYIYPGESIKLNVKANLAGNQTYKITWAQEPGLNNYNILTPEATPETPTTYTVTVKYGSCVSTAQVTVAIMNDVIAPNAFSPNGDGVNDSWSLKNIAEYPNARVYIYNRFGDVVFTSVGYPKPWDGTITGKPLPIGTYYYTIQLNDRKNKIYKGSVTIIH